MADVAQELSIVVPVRNREALLQRCLASIIAQTYRPLHVVIVDNDSNDASREVARQWAIANHRSDFRITVVDEPKPGASAARNRGLREVDTPFVAFFDSDDTMRPELAEKAMLAFAADEGREIVAWRVALHSGRTTTILHAPSRPLMKSQIFHSALRTHGYAMRTERLLAAGAWRESLPIWNDWELGIRLLLQNPKLMVMRDVLADVYSHPMSLSGASIETRAPLIIRAIKAAEATLQRSGDKRARKWERLVNTRRALLAARLEMEGHTRLANEIMAEALGHEGINSLRRSLLRFIYFYTRTGGRGSASMLAPLL